MPDELSANRWVLVLVVFSAVVTAKDYGLVISNGRVIDQETHFDGIANVAIRGGEVAKISPKELSCQRVIDVSGG